MIWKHRSVALDPWLPESERGSWRTIGIRGRTYLYFPLGTAVLSVPFVAAVDLLGGRLAAPDGSYDVAAEIRWQRVWAAMLTAATAAMLFHIARCRLPDGPAAALSLLAAFGTQLWSTAALGLWVDTMAVFLLSAALLHVWRADFAGGRIAPLWLGTLLAWLYFVRPTYAPAILCITALAAMRDRRAAIPLTLCGGVWLAGFIAFSMHVFGSALPPYYAAGRIGPEHVPAGLAGHFASPSRSFLIFWPTLPFIGWMLWRFRQNVAGVRWIVAGAIALAAQLWIHSALHHWWGGGSYGSRYTLGTVPWFFVVATIAVAAARGRCGPAAKWVAAMLCATSVFLHARGALSQATQDWYAGVDNGEADRLWDWREPQFLAGLVPRPVRHTAPDLRQTAHPADPAAAEAFGPGWSGAEAGAFRWTDGPRAEIHFTAEPGTSGTLVLDVAPYLAGGAIPAQRIIARLGFRTVSSVSLDHPDRREIRIPLENLRSTNRLVLSLPDAAVPRAREAGASDTRALALQLFAIRIEPFR